MHATARLAHLLELAEKGPALRAALAEEVAALLTDWPADCPDSMRAACETLLARAAHEVDGDTRARLRVRLYADPALAGRVLPREPQDKSLIETARGGGNLADRMAHTLGLSAARAAAILADPSGQALAAACKALNLQRVTYSTLALLAAPTSAAGELAAAHARLDVYDKVTASEAARQLRAWREGEAVKRHAAE